MSSPSRVRLLIACVLGAALALLTVGVLGAANLYPLTKPPPSQMSNMWARVVDPSSPLYGYTIEVGADDQGHLYADLSADGGVVIAAPDGGLVVQGPGTPGVPVGGVLSTQGTLNGYPLDVTGPGGVALCEENTQVANNTLLAQVSGQLPPALGTQNPADSFSTVAAIPSRHDVSPTSLDAGIGLLASGEGVVASGFLFNASDAGASLSACLYNGNPAAGGTLLLGAAASAAAAVASFGGVSTYGVPYDAGLYVQIPCSPSTSSASIVTVP